MKTQKPAYAGSSVQNAENQGLLGVVFTQNPDALGAHILAHHASTFKNFHALNVRLKLPLGLTIRVADVVSELRRLTAHFTLCHGNTSPGSIQISGRHATIETIDLQGHSYRHEKFYDNQ
jgi:hypothetical protein